MIYISTVLQADMLWIRPRKYGGKRVVQLMHRYLTAYKTHGVDPHATVATWQTFARSMYDQSRTPALLPTYTRFNDSRRAPRACAVVALGRVRPAAGSHSACGRVSLCDIRGRW